MLGLRKTTRYGRLMLRLLRYARFKRLLARSQPHAAQDTGEPQILVVKLDGISDYITFSQISSVFRQLHPEGHIILLCRPGTVELARANEFFDEVVALDIVRFRRDGLYRASAVVGLLSTNYSIVYQPAYNKSFWTEALVRSLRASERVTIEGTASPRRLHRWYLSSYDTVLKNPGPPLREWRIYEVFAKRLLPDYKPSRPRLWFHDDVEFVDELIRTGKLPCGPYSVLVPSVRQAIRRWPTEKWVELGRRMLAESDISLVLAGASTDAPQNNDILCGLGDRKRVYDLTGGTTLRQLASIISRAECLVGTETSAVHIAAFCDVPNVCIMGGGHWKRFYPYGDREKNVAIGVPQDCFGCSWNCSKKHADCVTSVPARAVFELIRRFHIGGCRKPEI